ncbi:MAG: proline racemase family protein [Desulfobacterales bacterium]|nr:proline racemase family protein [Desulfobacterales bacterium]
MAFGGAFYAFCRAEDLGVRLVPEDFRGPYRPGHAGQAGPSRPAVAHPPPARGRPGLPLRHDHRRAGPGPRRPQPQRLRLRRGRGRPLSPTGTGVSARAALHYAKGEIGLGEPFVVESILGTAFTGPGGADGGLRSVRGRRARGHGRAPASRASREFWIDPADPLRDGFILR